MKKQKGFALVAAMMLMTVLAVVAVAVLSLSAADRRRAIRSTRTEVREGCALSGLTYARTYFGIKYLEKPANWDLYFATPNKFNPMKLPVTTPAWTATKADLSSTASIAAIKTTNPDLFLDLDNDGKSDVYIFIRDNYDEAAPAAPNFQKDSDKNAIVGAVCISSTMLPKREDDSIDTDLILMESLLGVNDQDPGKGYAQASSSGNTNN